MSPEVMKAHRAALEEMARMYEADSGEGVVSTAYFLHKAARQIGRLLNDPHVPPEPQDKEPVTSAPRDDHGRD